MTNKTGIIVLNRPTIEYVSPKTDESQEFLERAARGEEWRRTWLEKRLKENNNDRKKI